MASKLRRAASLAACIALSVGGPATQAIAQVVDTNFDSQGSSVTDFCYFGWNCPGGSWSGTGSGFVHENTGNFAIGPAPTSPTAAFIQGTGYIYQNFTVPTSGVYRVAWMAAGRQAGAGAGFGGNQTYQVVINGPSYNVVAIQTTTTNQGFRRYVSQTFYLNAGTAYALIFAGQASTDDTAYIDMVYLDRATESATYSYDALGRLTSTTKGGPLNGGQVTTVTHDAASNRSNVTTTGAPQ